MTAPRLEFKIRNKKNAEKKLPENASAIAIAVAVDECLERCLTTSLESGCLGLAGWRRTLDIIARARWWWWWWWVMMTPELSLVLSWRGKQTIELLMLPWRGCKALKEVCELCSGHWGWEYLVNGGYSSAVKNNNKWRALRQWNIIYINHLKLHFRS